ncbi:MAG: glycine cleavage system aminomethyltransferase GcvT [Bacteroidales bacterium]|nr:glycine cleavage system aminomethyltransferase GcvT [Bacteroidales bacterium]
MKETVLTKLHKEAGARMMEYAGFNMPVEYSGVVKEHLAVRNAAGIFDVSHMGEFWVKGKNAVDLLQYTTTNNVSGLEIGKAQYSCMPNGKGGIVDDLIIYRFEPEKYMLVVNASNIEKDWNWLNKNNAFGAVLENVSDRMSLIALQGPKAKDILQKLVDFNLASLKSFTFSAMTVGQSENVIVSVTGYTGAGGFELYCHNQVAPSLWKEIMKAGDPFGLIPAGLAARDTLRLEMGYSLYGNDIDDTTSPIEAGLSWIVKMNKEKEFIDKKKYQFQMENGVSKKLVGFKLIDRGIPRKDYKLLNSGGEEIGKVTSGTMSPILQQGIGMGYLRTEEARVDNEIYVQVRNKSLKAIVVKLPFLTKQ